MLHAERAAVDLRGAQLDQFEQLLVHAGLGRDLAQCLHGAVSLRRLRLEVAVLAAGV